MNLKNSVNAFKALYNKLDIDKCKKLTKKYVGKYYKQATSIAVVATLGIVCTATAITQKVNADSAAGVMISVSDVAAGHEPFSGNTFNIASISYNEMRTFNYETGQLAQLEKSEKQIEQILSSRQQSRKEQAAIDQLTATSSSEPEVSSKPEESTTPVTAPTVVTFADENGTYEYVGEFTLTAYCPCTICCGQWSNMANPTTASGTTATAGRTIAADTSKFPFGTKLSINGQIYTVEDTGGAVVGNRIDIFFNSHQEALNFGLRTASVYIVK
ncbi:MAG: 3D domain-containing protein [Lachnospiraceae bacterium]|nr:3D domain-containing protein [Lachnospiraceae bacterium]